MEMLELIFSEPQIVLLMEMDQNLNNSICFFCEFHLTTGSSSARSAKEASRSPHQIKPTQHSSSKFSNIYRRWWGKNTPSQRSTLSMGPQSASTSLYFDQRYLSSSSSFQFMDFCNIHVPLFNTHSVEHHLSFSKHHLFIIKVHVSEIDSNM